VSDRPEVRPRRLVSRYVLSLAVRVQQAGLPSTSCQARNVSVGGVFLATDKAPQLLSQLTAMVTLPEGRSASLRGRVVHVLSGQRARSLGGVPGVGLQFEGLRRQEQAFVEDLVAWARAHDPRPRIARRKLGVDVQVLQHEPMLGFLLGYLDGKRDPEALAEELALELDTIERMLSELERHGAIELTAAGSLRATPQPTAAPQVVRSQRPLSPTQQDALSGLESRAKNADHYALLGVPAGSSPEQARNAYLKHSAELNPSVRPAEEAQRIERVLSQMRQAASALGNSERQEEYDEYKERAEWLAAAEALRGRMSIPPPAPGPSDGSDEEIDFRHPPPPSDVTPTAQHKRPGPAPSQAAREQSARARAAAAALRRPSAMPGRTSPPTAAAVPAQPAPTRPPTGDGSTRATVRPGASGPASAALRAQQLAAAARTGSPTRPPAAGETGALRAGTPSQPPAADVARPAGAASPSQPPPGQARSARPSRGPTASARTVRPSRPAAEAAAQAAAEQAAAAAALGARGRPSQSAGPSHTDKPAPNEPPLGAAGQILAQAEAAYGAGNTTEASRHLKLLLAMTFDDPRVQARFAELRLKVMRTAAVDFEKQAAYEEKQQHWAHAARSWLRVVEGRPTDSAPLQRAALALLRAGKDLRTAMESAKRAVELAPNEAEAHRTLAKVYVAADMQASARRELEAAQRCSGAEPSEDGTPTGLLKRLLGRDDGE